MTVIELINQLKDMPHNAVVKVEHEDAPGLFFRTPNPQMEYNDYAENYEVVL